MLIEGEDTFLMKKVKHFEIHHVIEQRLETLSHHDRLLNEEEAHIPHLQGKEI